jgi:acyl-CoA synthetase (AMP-forming)/AMP-acid ligase II/acyl carrier protein
MINQATNNSNLFSEFSNLITLLNFRASIQSEKIAYTFLSNGGKQQISLTYQQLNDKATIVAVSLRNSGYASKERALLLYSPGIDYIIAFFGCLYAGIVPVPVYPPRPNRSLSRLQLIVNDVEAKIALTSTSILASIEHQFERIPELKNLFWLATDNLSENIDLANNNVSYVKDDDIALIQYTSGSTGNPKGVVITHRNIISNSALIYKCFGHTSASRGVSWLPIYHDMGLIGGILQPLYGGFPVTLFSPTDFIRQPLLWLKTISECRATTSGAPNFAYEMCIDKINSEAKKSLDLSCWDLAFVGAEPIRAKTLDSFAEAFAECGFKKSALYPCYGMAEATLIISGIDKQELPVVTKNNNLANHKEIVGCGKINLGQKVIVVNSDNNQICLEKEIGEIWIKNNNCIARGYWNNKQLTQEIFQAKIDEHQDNYLKTGDLGFIEQGELFVTGRIKDIIIIRGQNYYPQDIEKTIEQSHYALKADSNAVFTVQVDAQEQLVVVQEVKRTYLKKLGIIQSNHELSTQKLETEIKATMRASISQECGLNIYDIQLIKTGTICKTSSGKIQRFLCKEKYLNEVEAIKSQKSQFSKKSEQKANITNQVNTKAIQDWLSRWLSNKLKIPLEQIDHTKAFAEYGIDSVMAVELAQDLEEWLPSNLEIEPTLAWNFPSIEALASYLGSVNQQSLAFSPDSKKEKKNLGNLLESPEILDRDLNTLSEEELMHSLLEEIALAKEIVGE